MSVEGKRAVVIGIDFGTTYSGAAWCYTGDPDKIRVIKSWPGIRSYQDKVPTILSYSTKGKNVESGNTPPKCKWGFEVKPDTPNQVSWFKLFLNDPTSHDGKFGMINVKRGGSSNTTDPLISADQGLQELKQARSNILSLVEKKKPVDIVADYLRELHTQLTDTLTKAYPLSVSEQLGKEIPLKYCLTVPAMWSDKAKALTIEAAKTAGIGDGKNEIRLISEPEAAAIHCLKIFRTTENGLKLGDVYVLADCGGGTVDLISYEITAVTPRLSVKEAAPGSGALCGSITLNRRFEELVKKRIGQKAFDDMTSQARWSALSHFEDYLKKSFIPAEHSDDEDEFEVESYYCPVPGVPNDVARGVQGGFLVLTSEDLVEVFRPSFEEIAELVQKQIDSAEEKSKKAVTGVLLVGGYGSSEYLHRYLEENIYSPLAKNFVKILQPADAWTAVVRGAVEDGVASHETSSGNSHGGGMVESRIARFSYGVAASEPFIEGVHPLNKLYYSYRLGEFMCQDRMTWFVEKGQEIREKEEIRVSLETTAAVEGGRDEYKATQPIYISEAATPPKDLEDKSVVLLCTYIADAYDTPRSYFTRSNSQLEDDDYWTIPMNMVMHYDSGGWSFSSEIRAVNGGAGTRLVGKSMTIEYNHESPGPQASRADKSA